MTLPSSATSRRLATAGLCAIAWALTRVPLPGLDPLVVHRFTGTGTKAVAPETLSLVALGLVPFLSAAFVVELALIARRSWRVLRRGTSAQRLAVQRAVLVVTMVFAAVQAWMMARYIQSLPAYWDELLAPGRLPFLAIVVTMVAGVALLLTIARAIERFGLGNGIAVLLAMQLVTEVPGLLLTQWQRLRSEQTTLLGALLPFGLLVLAGYVTAWLFGRGPQARPIRLAPPRPTAGIVPLVLAGSVILLPVTIANLGVHLPTWLLHHPGDGSYRSIYLVLCIAFAGLLSLLFHRPPTEPEARAAWQRTVLESIVGVAALAILSTILHSLGVSGVLVPMVALATALGLDWLDEEALRREHPELVVIGQWHDLATLDTLTKAWRDTGLAVLPRGAHVRRLFYVFGPHVQIDLMVPPRDVERATAMLQEPL